MRALYKIEKLDFVTADKKYSFDDIQSYSDSYNEIRFFSGYYDESLVRGVVGDVILTIDAEEVSDGDVIIRTPVIRSMQNYKITDVSLVRVTRQDLGDTDRFRPLRVVYELMKMSD